MIHKDYVYTLALIAISGIIGIFASSYKLEERDREIKRLETEITKLRWEIFYMEAERIKPEGERE